MILFLEGSQNGTDTAKSVWPACTASHSPAPVRPCGCRRILCFAERSAGRYAPPGAVCAGHTGEYHGLSEGGPVHPRGTRRRNGWGRTLSCSYAVGAHTNYAAFLGGAPGGSGSTTGQCGQRSGSTLDWRGNGLQRKLLEAALPPCPARASSWASGPPVSPENQYSLNNALAQWF